MKDKLYIKIAKLLPEIIIYWVVVFACADYYQRMRHLKNRDELNLNDLVMYWFNRTK